MKLVKILNIKGAVLDEEQLENYLEKIASDHVLQEKGAKETYPIPRLQDNFKFITKTYEMLNKHLKLGINIHPAGEWLLDNYYIIEEAVKTIQKELPLKKYINFVALANGAYKGFARIYVLATEIVAYTDSKINPNILKKLLKAYQRKKTLNMEEIWNINIFLQISIIENIRSVCEKIYSAQMQKYRVENILERLVEYKTKGQQQFSLNSNYKNKIIEPSQMKYPFIEYMSYRLKQMGKKTEKYLEVLEEQVMKMGTSVSEVIKKEHFDIAVKKVLIGNCIKSIKQIQRINFLEIFEEINGVEELLKKDPAKVYEKMDYKTKAYYREKIKEIANKTKISEIYITKKALELAQNAEEGSRQSHIGYYLIDDGKEQLYKAIQYNRMFNIKNETKVKYYIFTIAILSIILTYVSIIPIYKQTNLLIAIITFLVAFIPATEIVIQIINSILNKFVKPQLIPKMDYSSGVPKEALTMVIIPTIVKSPEKVKELLSKLEIFYLANKSENIYFTLLADTNPSSKEKEQKDEEIIKEGILQTQKLNDKYPNNEKFGRFQFIYRKRIWCEGENSFLGWERKRGLINQFNEYILGNIKNPFRANTMENLEIPKIKYVITLDADTDLVLNTGLELIGAASHILNKPVLNKSNDLVIKGHGIIQPRVGINLDVCRKSIFTQIFACEGGTDSYANAISDVYQDNFGEGIFTGKGIYDLQAFSTVLKEQIPENTVLSHDLLEGSYLRCGLASDILLLDGYPSKYISFVKRLHRWIRGDVQISGWLKKDILTQNKTKKKNPLKLLDKFKILDNLRRCLIEVTVLLAIIYMVILKVILDIKIWPIILLMFITILIPQILTIFSYLSSQKNIGFGTKTFSKSISGIKASLLRGIICILTIPHKAYYTFDAIIRTRYRMKVSKKHLLEWTTAEESENLGQQNLKTYYKEMFINVIAGIIGIIIISSYDITFLNIILYFICILFLIAPAILWYISKEKADKVQREKLNKQELDYVLDIGKRTWSYFDEYMNKENNYLPPDNYQENRNPKVVKTTSSTNIGLGALSIISAYDLGYIDLAKAMDLIKNLLDTIQKLQKWNGHLYNWYNIKTLQPLAPRYISTVDSGNFIGYMFVLKVFLEEIKEKENYDVEDLILVIDNIIKNTDFKVLYDYEKRLFSIGFDIEENKLTDSYYDLLASEARQASLIAIAKNDIPSKHWQNLSRTLTTMNGYKGLVSWSGTAFEYLMPNINIKTYPSSLIDESCKFMLMSQMEYAKKLGIPWGISESAFNLKDLNSNYQYKAFGIPWLGLKRGLADEMVVSAYGSILAIFTMPKEVIANIKKLEELGMYQKYGFYEAVDYTPERLKKKQKYEIVKNYMAHHQGLILISINNLINNNIIQKRFSKNPEIQAVDVILQERMPKDVIITKEKKEKIEKIKNIDYENYTVKTITKLNSYLNNYNVISNENYTTAINERGEGFSQYKNILINRFKITDDESQGIQFYIKNLRTNKIWNSIEKNSTVKPSKYEVNFTPDMCKFVRVDDNIQTTIKVVTAPNEPVEIRTIELKNNSLTEETLEITGMFEPVLSSKEQDYAHRAFNNLFLRYKYIEDSNSILIRREPRGSGEPINLAVNLQTQNKTIGELEYEIDGEKLNAGAGMQIPKAIENSLPFSKSMGLTVNPVVALKRTISIKPNEKAILNLVISVSESEEEAKENLNKYLNTENVKKAFELSRVRVEEEARYLGIRGKDIENYQKMLSYIIAQNPLRKMYMKDKNVIYEQKQLWKFGISGDEPILLVKIKDINDIYVIKDILKAYEFFRIKNIKVDLVILNLEENMQERYIKDAVKTEISNKHLMYLMQQRGGIFLLNSPDAETQELLEFKANLIIDAHNGNIKTALKEQEDEYLNSLPKIEDEIIKNKPIQEDSKTSIIDVENLKYYNGYGGFSEDGKEYIIKETKDVKLPTTWSNVLSNEHFGTIVTNNFAGYTWYKNSRLNRITDWSNNTVLDTPSEIIYLQDKDYGKTWTLSSKLNNDEEDYYTVFGLGYAKYINIRLGLLQELETFVPINDNVKVNILRIKNTSPEKRELKLIYYIKPVLGEDIVKTNGTIDVKFDKDSNIVFGKSLYTTDLEKTNCYISSSVNIKSFTGNKRSFIGENGNLSNPEAINKISLDGENALGQESCIAIEFLLELKAYEDKEISIVLGSDETEEKMKEIAYKYTEIENCKKELEETKKYWLNEVRKVQIKTPVESMNILLNGWLVYQTIACRLWARTGLYQSGGAFGYRDQLQDTMGIKYINEEYMKKQILKHAKHQFIEGDVEHWWHDETKKGIRTKFSDDLLWLPYVTSEYINFTGKYDILDEEEPYVQAEVLEENQDEKYDIHLQTENKDSIYVHCLKAIDKGINIGENGLPKIGTGDWNDGFSTVGNKGKGESVWLGFFLYEVLNRFIPICEYKKDFDRVEKYKKVQNDLKHALNNIGWDGKWFRRAFTDDGKILGTRDNEECRIDSISQSWAVISDAGENDKKYIAMESLENHLVDRENLLIKLLDPPFEKSDIEPGYIKAYLPGIRENGGQYTHVCC